jgi:hypothetical protein
MKGFESEEQFVTWPTYYYLHPEPERVPSAVRYYAESRFYQDKKSRAFMATFFASLFRQDVELLRTTYEVIGQSESEDTRVFFLYVLWVVDTEASRAFLAQAKADWTTEQVQRLVASLEGRVPDKPLEDAVDSPADLDRLWAMFEATGDAAAVRKIISVLHWVEDGHGEELILGGAARWSLTSQAQQHQRVHELCQQELQQAAGTTRNLLEQVLAEADNKER